MKNSLIKTEKLCKSFVTGKTSNNVLRNIDLEIYEGDFTIIMGSSGSGKSTLLYSLSTMDTPTSGKVELLEKLGLADSAQKYPSELSGGQQQRVSIGRALISGAKIIFGDEPTGALNSSMGKQVLDLFTMLNNEGQSIVMVTHDIKAAARATRLLYLNDGKIDGELNLGKYLPEEKRSREEKIKIFMTVVFGMLLLTAAVLCFFRIHTLKNTLDIHALRTDAMSLVGKIERTQNYDVSTSFSYAVILTDGTVAYNRNTALDKSVNLHTLDSDFSEFYTVPILTEGRYSATLYIVIPQQYFGTQQGKMLGWKMLFVVITLISTTVYVIMMKTLKNDIYDPICHLHMATRDILGGKLDTSVDYDYEGEVGTLCHDFELMRTELVDSQRREQKLREDEKVLMANISHDLKTPLATVQGYLESICLGVVTAEDDIKMYCENALDKTVLLGKMINDIMEHSKAELTQLSINREEVYTRDYFEPLLKHFQADAKNAGISLYFTDIPNVMISLDSVRIAQVMENLIGNSMKYGKEDGKIEVSFHIENKDFFVKVSDNGQGIAAEDLPFVFGRFFRGDKARTQSIPGSGLGLSIAKYIVEQHGGVINCDSILGQGTTVEFCIRFL